MLLSESLGITNGVTSVIGSGGKTSLLATLARELPGRVILTTSTRILPFEDMPLVLGDAADVAAALEKARCVCVCSVAEKGKLGAPSVGFDELAQLTDYVLVEADGSKRLPLKAHATWEPVIPACSTQTILAVGASAFGRPVGEVAHRLDLFCKLAGCVPGDAATPEMAARVIEAEGLADRVLVNQIDGADELELARRVAAGVSAPVVASSLRTGWFEALG